MTATPAVRTGGFCRRLPLTNSANPMIASRVGRYHGTLKSRSRMDWVQPFEGAGPITDSEDRPPGENANGLRRSGQADASRCGAGFQACKCSPESLCHKVAPTCRLGSLHHNNDIDRD